MKVRATDLTGSVFGKLTVVRDAGRASSGDRLWLCVCQCGKEKTVRSWNLSQGKTKSCGCLKVDVWTSGKRQRRDLTGARFGQLTVIAEDGHIGVWRAWRCICDCGKECVLRDSAFAPSRMEINPRISCGCRKAQSEEMDQVRAARAAAKAALPKKKRGKPIKIQIDPDIKARNVSRQRKLQLQWKRMGRCVTCGNPSAGGRSQCAAHAKYQRDRYVPVVVRKVSSARKANWGSFSSALSVLLPEASC